MKKRLFALALALLMLCAGCAGGKSGILGGGGDKGPEAVQSPAGSQLPEPSQSPEPDPSPATQQDRDRRAALLTALDALSAEQAMYARLGDLNGDGEEDILIFGLQDFQLGDSCRRDFCFSGVVWDGTQAQVVPFDAFEYQAIFGSDRFDVYRDKDSGLLYASYSFSMDNVAAVGFQNAVEYVPMSFECGYETPEELAEWEELSAALQQQIDQRFELVESVVFPERQVNGFGIPESFYWTEYWNNYDAERPQLPPFYSTVADVRAALSDSAYGADAKTTLPFAPGTLNLYFSSGVGGWGTELTLQGGGTFQGDFHDSDLGSSGPGYDATIYVCSFTGSFKDIRRVNDYTWSMTMDALEMEEPSEKEWIEDEGDYKVRYVTAEAYGVHGGKEFLLYTPQAPSAALPEPFLSWHRGWANDPTQQELLGCYGLYNVDDGSGFYSG